MPPPRLTRGLPPLAVLLAAALPALAGAQGAAPRDVPLPPPPVGTRPVPAARAAPPAWPAPRPVRFHLQTGFDFGFEQYAEVEFDDGSTDSLDLNDGLTLSAGVAFLPLLGGRLDTVATAGFKYWKIGADNGSLKYVAFPLELVERVRLHPNVRLGTGLSWQLAPGVRADGVAAPLEADAKSSLGILFQAEGTFATGPAEWSVGLRYLWQKLEAEDGGPAVGANALGFFFGWSP